MRTKKPTKTAYWLARLDPSVDNRQFVWTPTDTRSIIRALNHPAPSEMVESNQRRADIRRLLSLRPTPIRVNDKHEAKAHAFWRSNCRTRTNEPRNNQFTRSIAPLAMALIDCYLDGKGDAHHRFAGVVGNNTSGWASYWADTRCRAIPLWRMEIPGIGWCEYTYGSWQSNTPLTIVDSGMYPPK